MKKPLQTTSELKNIEVVQMNMRPINPSCYSFYKPTENDTKNIFTPENTFNLNNHHKSLLRNCFLDNSKIPYGQLAEKLISLNSDSLSKAFHQKSSGAQFGLEQELESKDNKLIFLSFLGKNEFIQNSLIYISVEKCPEQPEASIMQIRNSKGEILFLFYGIRIQQPQKRILKKMQILFKGENTIVIVNSNHYKYSMDCSFFSQLLKTNNQFIYIQNNLKVVTEYKSFDEEVSFFSFQFEESNHQIIFFIDTLKYGTIICSKKSLGLYLQGYVQFLIKQQCRLRELYQNQFLKLGIPSRFGEFGYHIRSSILNLMLSNSKTKISCDQAVKLLIRFFLEMSEIVQNRVRDVEKRKKSAHHPAIMKHCRQCKVCVKIFVEQQGNEEKKQKKSILIQQKKDISESQSSKKIKKTKYCCEGCSVHYKKQIPICVLCFKQFHSNLPLYMDKQYKAPHQSNSQKRFFSHKQLNQLQNLRHQKRTDPTHSLQIESITSRDNLIMVELMQMMKSIQQELMTQLNKLEPKMRIFENGTGKINQQVWSIDLRDISQ